MDWLPKVEVFQTLQDLYSVLHRLLMINPPPPLPPKHEHQIPGLSATAGARLK